MTSNRAMASGLTRLTAEMMCGEALEPYAEGVLASGFLETVTPHQPGHKMLAVFSGEIWVALFEFTGGENRAVFFPGDEFVYVVAGTLTLTDANSAEARTFAAGEYVFIPKGWQGSWANEGFYREVAVCSRDWLLPYERTFQPGIVDAERRMTFLPVEAGAGDHFTRDECFVVSRNFRGAWQPSEDYVAVVVGPGVAP